MLRWRLGNCFPKCKLASLTDAHRWTTDVVIGEAVNSTLGSLARWPVSTDDTVVFGDFVIIRHCYAFHKMNGGVEGYKLYSSVRCRREYTTASERRNKSRFAFGLLDEKHLALVLL